MDLSQLHLHWRISHYNGKSYRSYSLARAYRHEGKNRKEIVLTLGKLSDEKADKWRNLLKAIKQPDAFLATLSDLVVTNHYAYLDVAVVSLAWKVWELDNVFLEDAKKDINTAVIARVLAINRSIDPSSKLQVPEWFHRTALPWLLDIPAELINPSRIFRELAIIEQHKEDICKHLFKRLSQRKPQSMERAYYDLSSTTFTGSSCVLMKWGHCKEGYSNHVVLALVVNSDGLPFYWEVLQGGTADANTITWLLGRLKQRFKDLQTTLVFDRGMVSDENLTILEKAEIKYITAMDKSQLQTITGLDFSVFSYLDPKKVEQQANQLPGFQKLNDTIYYQEIKVKDKRRYILCFNPELFKRQRKTRDEAVTDFRLFASELNSELLEAKNSRQRKQTYDKFKQKLKAAKLNGFIDIKLVMTHLDRKTKNGLDRKVRTYQGVISIDDTAMRLAGKLDGFWLIVTNHSERIENEFTFSAKQTIIPYRDKVIIESAFRDIKSFVKVAPVYVWTEDHVKAHYTICVLSHLINRTLTLRLHKNQGDKTREVVFHEKLYARLSDCCIDRIEATNVGLSTYNMTRPTPEQKELLERIGFPNLLSHDVVAKARASMQS